MADFSAFFYVQLLKGKGKKHESTTPSIVIVLQFPLI